MNKFYITFFLLMLACMFACAQMPEKMTYQSVVRDVNNSLVVNRNVSVRIWILQGSADGAAVYVETQSVTTNANGLMTLVLGDGTVVSGSLSAINWASGPYFLKAEIDPAGGSNYSLMSVQELLSVPYALYANEAANSFSGDYNDLENLPQIPQIPAEISAFTNDAGYLTPATVQDAVTIPTNVSAFTNDAGYITPAQVPAQVNADWNAADGAAEILNKPTVPAATNNAMLTIQQNGTAIGTFTANASSDTTLNVVVPTATDQLVNDIGYLTSDSFPMNVSTFTNDAGYLTAAQCGDTSLCEMANMITTLQSQIGQLQTAIGQLAVELDSLEEARFTCGTSTVKDFDDNIYHTVQIGNQCWMKENLRTTHYADGTEIPTSIYLYSSVAYRYYPNNDSSLVPTYGYLYNWTAVMHSSASSSTNPSGVQGICPVGWHVPSRAEWTQLTDFVSGQVQYACNGNNLKIAKALSSTTGWDTSATSCAVGNNPSTNDATGFSALPNGYYYNAPYFFGSTAFFWSAEHNNDNNSSAWHYMLNNESGTVSDNTNTNKSSAKGVRCVRDALGLSGTLPTVTTDAVSDITPVSATCGGEVTADNDTDVTARGVCWGTSQNPTLADSHTTDSTGTGSFTSILTNLTPNTTYYVRAYATNSLGTSYGQQESFTTQTLVLPTVILDSISNITFNTAVCNSTVTAAGNGPVIARGVCWKTNGIPSLSDSHTTDSTGLGSFTSSITDLTPGTTYFVRAYATNNQGTKYSQYQCFTTPTMSLPAVTTESVRGINYTIATCEGLVTSEGDAPVIERGFCWSTYGYPMVDDNHIAVGSGSGNFIATLTDLTFGTHYFVRAYATSSAGTTYGNLILFTTLSYNSPEVITASASDVTKTSFTCGGDIIADGGAPVTARGICWKTTADVYPTLADDHTTEGSGLGEFTSSVTGLTPNTIYYVRAYATNSAGTNYGDIVRVTTSPLAVPTVTNLISTDRSYTTVVCNAEVIAEGDAPVTERGFCWSEYGYPTLDDDHIAVGSGLGSYMATLSGLTIGTGYHVRAYATSSLGTAYSELISLSTRKLSVPLVETAPVSDITQTSFTSGGSVIEDGGTPVTAQGICWNTTANVYPTLADNYTTDSSGLGDFTSFVTGLDPNTLYYVRAYATNSTGTGYGNVLAFWTSSLSLPTVTTAPVSDVAYTTVTCSGEVISEGDAPVTERGICWFTSGYPTIDSNHIAAGSGSGSFTITLSGLDDGTTYYVRAYAISSAGTAYGEWISFTTLQMFKPTVTTDSISNISYTSFTCNGNVTDDGGGEVTARGVCWTITDGNPTLADDHTIDGSGLGEFTSNVTGLASNTYYRVRAYATNSKGTNYGRVMFVKTLPFSLPTVMTNPITDVTKTSFICGGNVTADGGDEVTARGICWNTTANVYPTLADNHTTDGSGLGDFTDSITDLTPNTLYFVRAYATNSAGTQYGDLKHVWTLPLTMPSVTTAPVTDITEHTATCGGEVTVEGDAPVTERGVCWAYTSYPTVNDNHIAAGSGLGSFTATITGLSIGTRYFVRAYAISSLDTVYGEMDAFTTMRYYLPSVNTDPVSDISKTSFTCGGEVTADGGAPVIARGVCWNTTGNPTLADDHTTDGSGLGVFTSNITGLTPNTFYYVCAYATNSQGTSYGSLKSFWTLPLAEPTVITAPVTDITYATATCGGEVTDEGDAPVTERGVCWGTSVYPTVNDNHIAAGSGLGSFTVTLSGLDAGTTYYARAYAISSAGITYSVPVYFITSWRTTPTVITDTLSNIAPTSFVCGGRVTDDGGFPVTARGICWSNMGYPTLANDHTTDGAGLGDFTSSVTDLIPGQVYYIRAYATNERGTTYGDVRLMTTTLLTKPLVKITQLGEITKTKITVVCKVVDSGGQPVTARGICWNTTGNPTLADNNIIDSTGLDDFTSTISGLTPNTVYYVSAYAINSVGTSYSNPLFSISTLPYLAPTVTTNPISDYSHTMLTCGGTVTGEGDAPVTTRGLCWSTTHQFPTIDDNYIVEGGSGLGSFTSTISNLNPGEFVYVRAFASNNYGTGYGEQQSVYLPPYPEPTVIASHIQDLKRTSAVVKCNVQEKYNHPVIARGVCWSTSPQPTLNDNHTVNGAGPGNYQSYITDLTPTTTYYLRAYAVTDQVTAYSNELEFTTIGFTYCDSITIPYACDFTIPEENQCWTIVDANNDDATFTFENSNWCVAYYGYHYESAQAVADEYLISPMIPFDGHKNVVRYKYWSSCNYIPAIYEVLAFGPDTVVLYPPDTVRTGVRTPKRLDVSNLNGNYAIAIHCISDNNRSCIEFSDFSVYEATLPEVSTENVGRVTDFTARCHGYWTDDGNADTEFGFCWSTSPNPTVNDSHLPEDVGQNYMHYFYTDLTGLTPGTHYYVRAYATNMVGTVYGEQLEFTTTLFSLNGIPCPGTPTVTDVDNNTYNTVGLDGVCWMKENLRTTHYADNTPIAYGGDNLSTTTAYRYYPNNNINNVSTYGYLYNMAAVRHGVEVTSADTIGKQGICPTGWHVPSHDEYANLFSTLNRHIDQYICYYDGSFGWYGGTAKALASTQGWTANYDPDEEIWPCSPVENPSTNNATNFSALPAGYRYGGNPDYYLPDEDFGKIALIWSYHGSVLHIEGRYPDAYFAWLQDDKFGCSVRCLRDRPLTFDY